MFDAKKLLDALGTPAAAEGQAPTAVPAASSEAKGPDVRAADTKAPADSKPAAAQPLGAGTLLSDLIDFANRPGAPTGAPSGDAATPVKAAPPPPPADLTDLLLRRAQDYLKTPQGNAAVHAALIGVTKAVVQSEAGRRLTATAKTRGTALFNRLLNKTAGDAPPPQVSGAEAPALPPPASAALPAPAPSGEQAGVGTESTLLVLRAMIAAAAADGRIDEGERMRILGALQGAGIGEEGVHLIEAELSRPAGAAELAAAVRTPEEAVQVYTVARRIITPNTVEERVFLAHLSAALGLAPQVVARIDAMASGAIPGEAV